MFQSFDQPDLGRAGPERVAAIRAAIAAAGFDGFLIPRADVHQGEYVPPSDERLAWATGFTGSAGAAAVLTSRAAVFVDGRYTLQADRQVDADAYEIDVWRDGRMAEWLAEAAGESAKIAYDPWLHGKAEVDRLSAALVAAGASLAPADANIVDQAWEDRPPPPAAAIRVHPDRLSGEPASEKRARIGAAIAAAGADAALLTLPDSIAWLFNIRGADIPRNPVPLCFAILRADGTARLFLRPGQADAALADHLGPDVAVEARDGFRDALAALNGDVLLDRRSCPVAAATLLAEGGARIVWGTDPCILPKAIKNDAELAGAREAHLRDGAAMVRFLAWLDREAPGGGVTEIDAARQLEGERRATNALMDISFDTISGAGPDGAIVHYRVTRETDRALRPGELYLVDSGGQYLDGTTDITRTIAIGPPPADAARAFTLVLKGMIAVSRARFPEGTSGRDVDVMARAALWRAGFDYDHGTGHGIGSYLCVHEGPQSISRRGDVALQAGMMCSNEPGYYREGAFGVRIENLIHVTPPETPEGGDRRMMAFETLTLCPIDRRLVLPDLLTRDELDWLNAYHARVREALSPLVEGPDADWLSAACRPIERVGA